MKPTDHLWRHFTAAGAPQLVIERGEGCYIWDNEGNRYLDALSALYCVNIGYGPWPGITEAAQKQLEDIAKPLTAEDAEAEGKGAGAVDLDLDKIEGEKAAPVESGGKV